MSFKLKPFIFTCALISTLFVYSPAKAQYYTYDVAPATSRVKFTYSLASAIPFISANLPYDSNYRGQGVYTVILDTGVEVTHPFFQNRVALEACFAALCPNGTNQQVGPGAAKPVHWHGTHVAGITAGYNSSIHGVAPESKIIAVNVFDSTGAAYDDDIVRALNWVASISDQYNISSINMSLGGSTTYLTSCDDYMPAMTTAIENLRAKNIATVIAAGNNYSHGMSAPACISSSVSVAAMYTNSSTVTNFSNINKFTTIAAPGSSIVSSKTNASYGSASGTSMATPFITGSFAVYRSKFGVQSVDKVVSDFRSTLKTAYDAYTGITIPSLDFSHLFSSENPTPTPTTTTTVPITTTTVSPTTTVPVTTTTVPVTTTTLPVTTTTVPVTTTTVPVTTTTVPVTTTTVPTIPSPNPVSIYSPILHEIDGSFKTFVQISYRDPYSNSSYVSHYILTCNDSDTYVIPRDSHYGWNVYNLKISPANISYCTMKSSSYDVSFSRSTSKVYIYPNNSKVNSSSQTIVSSQKTIVANKSKVSTSKKIVKSKKKIVKTKKKKSNKKLKSIKENK